MNDPSPFLQSIRQALEPTARGVVGLVDNLFELCQARGLQLDWRAGQCRVRSIGMEPEESIEVRVPKSVFRAVLARLATLCNELNPGSFSPYGTEGELTVDVDPATVCRVTFTNTPDEQRVQLTRIEHDDRATDRRQPEHSGPDSDPRLRAPATR